MENIDKLLIRVLNRRLYFRQISEDFLWGRGKQWPPPSRLKTEVDAERERETQKSKEKERDFRGAHPRCALLWVAVGDLSPVASQSVSQWSIKFVNGPLSCLRGVRLKPALLVPDAVMLKLVTDMCLCVLGRLGFEGTQAMANDNDVSGDGSDIDSNENNTKTTEIMKMIEEAVKYLL